MKAEFENQLNQLLGEKKERTLLMTDDRYNELLAETKQGNERRRRGLELSAVHYRRLKRFDVMTIGGHEKLVQKSEEGQGSTKKIYFCMVSEMFDVLHSTHLRIGHKREKAMEFELKKKYCNITREVIAIYLSLCRDCASKKRYKAIGLLTAKSKPVPDLTSCCQIDIINMEIEPDGVYKFILNYQDCQSKFLVLRPLKTATPEEVADVLFDIFCLIRVPSTLLSGNESEYCDQILHHLSSSWNVKLIRGEEHYESVWKDILKSLAEWMSDNQTHAWAPGLRIIQCLKNRCFNPLTQQTPHEAMFGQRTHSPSKNAASLKIQTDKKVKEQLTLLKQKLDEVNKMTKDIMENLEAPPQSEKVEVSPDTKIKCLRCSKVLLPEVFCWKCNGPLHFNCALTNDDSENPFCQICASNSFIQTPRTGRKRRLGELSQDFTVGDKVMMRIPEDEAAPNRKASVGTKSAILERLFYRNESLSSGGTLKAESPPTESKAMNGFKTKRHKSKSKSVKKYHSKYIQCNL